LSTLRSATAALNAASRAGLKSTLGDSAPDGSAAAIEETLGRDGVVGDLIAEVMVEKTSYDVTAPADGMLRIRIPAETPFKRGAIIAAIG